MDFIILNSHANKTRLHEEGLTLGLDHQTIAQR